MRRLRFFVLLLNCGLLTVFSAAGQQPASGWWMKEPIRLVQTNLRQTDSDLDPAALAQRLEEFPANVLLFSVGGIVAHYPTRVEFHYPSEFLPEGGDLVGSVLRETHKRGIRVIGRFDFSRARKEVYQAHPEWFFRNRAGEPVIDDNGLVSSCINGGYYHQKALEVLEEALGRYALDGVFFNWFGNLRWDYKGNDIGLCHCDECSRRFRSKYGREIPAEPDREYQEFMFQSSREVAGEFRALIKRLRPEALFMTYIQEYTDGIVDEADFYKVRPLPLWIYSASENVNRARNSYPDKMSFNLVMPYQEMRYRFASTPAHGLRTLLFQNLAQGAFPAFVLLGTFDQPDMTAVNSVKEIFGWHRRYEDYYVGVENAGRVVLFAPQDPGWSSHGASYRGYYRLLSELHVPFRVTHRVDTITPAETDLVVLPEGPVPTALERYVREGGRVLVGGTVHPGLGFPEARKLWKDIRASYMRIESHEIFPSLQSTDVVFWEGDYLELEENPAAAVTLIPPGPFGPPDMVSTLGEHTHKPGLVVREVDAGQAAYIPWDLGGLYYRYSNDKHRWMVADLIDFLLPSGRQLETAAHPLVEISVTEQPAKKRTLVHLVNLIGHGGTAIFEPVEVRNIPIALKGEFVKARALRSNREIPIRKQGAAVTFRVPGLLDYEVVVLE